MTVFCDEKAHVADPEDIIDPTYGMLLVVRHSFRTREAKGCQERL